MALLDLATYKTLTNTTTSDNDALITLLLDISTEQIEGYCDRIFEAADYIEWFTSDGSCNASYTPNQYPVNTVKLVAPQENALVIVNGYTTQVTIDVTDTTLTITDESLTSNSYDLTDAANDTLTELAAVIGLAYPSLTITVKTEANQLSKLLKEQVTYTVDAGATVNIQGAGRASSDIQIKNNIIYGISKGLIVYNGGYATIPSDLQLACANIIRDSLYVQTGDLNANLKSENITNYSYTLADTVELNTIISAQVLNYASTLNRYRRITI